jgi:predicted small metal-binding protein
MRAMLCSCKNRLVASDNEELYRAVLDHLGDYHPVVTLSTERIREMVLTHSYEFNEVVGVGANPEEEFGIDPY